jgi:hypothetical protein
MGVPYLIAGLVIAVGAVAAWLARPLEPDPRRRVALVEAARAVDRELAANLELMSMFDQTKQAVVLENAAFARHRVTLEADAAAVFPAVVDLYDRIPDTESAMERRGPANTIKDEDRRTIEAWEGDARATREDLRAALSATPRSGWQAAMARLRRSPASR